MEFCWVARAKVFVGRCFLGYLGFGGLGLYILEWNLDVLWEIVNLKLKFDLRK